jgi:hypothetical protein
VSGAQHLRLVRHTLAKLRYMRDLGSAATPEAWLVSPPIR